MSDINLGQLLGSKSFTDPYTVSHNGSGIDVTALADTGANAFVLIDTRCAFQIVEFLDVPIENLPKPIPVWRYNGGKGKPIVSMLRIHLQVDRQKQNNIPFLVTDLGDHNIILGRKWLAYLGLWLDVQNRRLGWPKNLPRMPLLMKETNTNIKTLIRKGINPTHQADAARRDQALCEETQSDKVPLHCCMDEELTKQTTHPKPSPHKPLATRCVSRHSE